MGRQKGGRIFYEATRLTTPESVEGVMIHQPIPSPSQTTGQCATDATTVALYYADGIREALWSWFFANAPGGKVNIPDEELTADVLAVDKQKLTRAFLMTIGARVLRIFESEESRTFRRPTSGRVSPGMHGTSPSEVCSNLGTSLARVLARPIKAPGEVLVVDPGTRSGPTEYTGGTGGKQQTALLDWVANTFLRTQVDPSVYGTFSVGRSARLGGRTSDPVAMWINLLQIESEERPYVPEGVPFVGHAFAVVRINGNWYIADNNVGYLLPLVTADYEAGPLTPEMLDLLSSYHSHDVYFELQYTYDTSGGGPPPYSEAQYFLRNKEGEALAMTPKKRMLLPSAAFIMREVFGIQQRGEARPMFFEPRTILYWKQSGRVTPSPVPGESIISRFAMAPAAAGSGGVFEFGGKRRKTRRKRRSRRASKGRPSLPKRSALWFS